MTSAPAVARARYLIARQRDANNVLTLFTQEIASPHTVSSAEFSLRPCRIPWKREENTEWHCQGEMRLSCPCMLIGIDDATLFKSVC